MESIGDPPQYSPTHHLGILRRFKDGDGDFVLEDVSRDERLPQSLRRMPSDHQFEDLASAFGVLYDHALSIGAPDLSPNVDAFVEVSYNELGLSGDILADSQRLQKCVQRALDLFYAQKVDDFKARYSDLVLSPKVYDRYQARLVDQIRELFPHFLQALFKRYILGASRILKEYSDRFTSCPDWSSDDFAAFEEAYASIHRVLSWRLYTVLESQRAILRPFGLESTFGDETNAVLASVSEFVASEMGPSEQELEEQSGSFLARIGRVFGFDDGRAQA